MLVNPAGCSAHPDRYLQHSFFLRDMKTLSLLLCTLTTLVVNAQWKGKVVNTLNAPVPGASIRVSSSRVVIADTGGIFPLDPLPASGDSVLITAAGYQPLRTVFNAAVNRFVLFSNSLAAVTVSARRPVINRSAEGLTLSLANDIAAAGTNALQVLEKSPGVQIDPRNGDISLLGRPGTSLYVDGRPYRGSPAQQLSWLQSLQASDIDRIELLDAPGSRYDAEGTAGIINIILKKNARKNRFSQVQASLGQAVGEKALLQFQAAQAKGHWNWWGSYSYNRDRSYSDLDITSEQSMPAFGGYMTVKATDSSTSLLQTHQLQGGFEFQPDSSWLLGFSLQGSSSGNARKTNSAADYLLQEDSSLRYDGRIENRSRWNNGLISLYGRKTARSGEWRMQLDHLQFHNNNPSEIYSRLTDSSGKQADDPGGLFAAQQRGYGQTTIQVWVAKIDWQKKLAKNWRMDAGMKITFSRVHTASGIESRDNGDWIPREETINTAAMREKIGALYLSAAKSLNSNNQLQTGLRWEYTQQQLDRERRYNNLFPYLAWTSRFHNNLSLDLSFSSRISRPAFNDLASYMNYSDPTAVYTGNPALQPGRSYQAKAAIAKSGYSFTLIAVRDVLPIIRYQLTEAPDRNLLFISPQNMKGQNSLTGLFVLPVTLTRWWNITLQPSAGWKRFTLQHTAAPVAKTWFYLSLQGSSRFTLPRGFQAELSAWYNNGSYNGSVHMNGLGAVTAAVRKTFLRNESNLSFSVTDIFRGIAVTSRYGTLKPEAFDIRSLVLYQSETARLPVFRVTYTYPFGNKNRKNERPVAEENERVQRN